jgi:hypothetical protein
MTSILARVHASVARAELDPTRDEELGFQELGFQELGFQHESCCVPNRESSLFARVSTEAYCAGAPMTVSLPLTSTFELEKVRVSLGEVAVNKR